MMNPQMPQGDWQYYYYQNQRNAAMKTLRSRSNRAAGICLAIIATEFAISFLDIILGIFFNHSHSLAEMGTLSQYLQEKGMTTYLFFYMCEYLLMMGIPLLIGLYLFRKDTVEPIYVAKINPIHTIMLILVGIGITIAANYVGTIILNLLSMIGITPVDMPELQDGSWQALVLNILIIGVLPAILEETLFRGLVLQSLRYAGDTIAIIVSALLFGLMHGTLYQIPFAFILGIAFGYIAIRTGNILITMFLHFYNNSMSVILEYIFYNDAEEVANNGYLLYFFICAVIGIIGVFLLIWYYRHNPRPAKPGFNPLVEKKTAWKCTFGTPCMIAFIAIMALMTLFTTNIEGLQEIIEEAGCITNILGSLFHG